MNFELDLQARINEIEEMYKRKYDELKDAKAIIQRQAELISYFINEYPQTKNLAEIKSAFEEVNHGKE